MLIVFSGLPGTGKTTLAKKLAARLRAVYLRADTIEQALHQWMPGVRITREGYEVAYAVAAENLRLGLTVIADSVNPFTLTRDAWRALALEQEKSCLELEIICSNAQKHRKRIEQRTADIQGLVLPGWTDVLTRQYEPWERAHLVIDTSEEAASAQVEELERIVLSCASSFPQAGVADLPLRLPSFRLVL